MPPPADLRFATSELDRSVQALKNIGCDDEQLLAGNTAMAALIRSGAEEIEKQEQQMQFLCIENDSNRETVKAWKDSISEVRAILGCAPGERTQHAAERLMVDLAVLRAEVAAQTERANAHMRNSQRSEARLAAAEKRVGEMKTALGAVTKIAEAVGEDAAGRPVYALIRLAADVFRNNGDGPLGDCLRGVADALESAFVDADKERAAYNAAKETIPMKKQKESPAKAAKTGRPVLICTAHRGVFFGYADDTSGDTIILRKCRMVVEWTRDMKGVLGLASIGPSATCRISPAADVELRAITAVAECTPEAVAKWETFPWRP